MASNIPCPLVKLNHLLDMILPVSTLTGGDFGRQGQKIPHRHSGSTGTDHAAMSACVYFMAHQNSVQVLLSHLLNMPSNEIHVVFTLLTYLV